MSVFAIGTPTSTYFGEGCRAMLRDLEEVASASAILVVASDTSLKREPVASLVASFQDQKEVNIWDTVNPNPRTQDIDACLDSLDGKNVDCIVGIGGGSALDQAKATAMALHHRCRMEDLISGKLNVVQRSNKLILLPTTSGTGAELSYGSILTDMEQGEKLGLRGEKLAADWALVDPELTYSMPEDVTMVTGFDVLTHALETYLSKAATPYTEDLSRSAIRRVFQYLPRLKDTPGDKTARREIAYASMMMGHTLALSTTCLPHRLQYPLGAATDTAHAAGLAALYPAWLNHVQPKAVEKLADCAALVGVADLTAADPENADRFTAAVKDLLKRIDLDISMKDLGVTDEMAAGFASKVSGKLDTDPGYVGYADLEKIYLEAQSAPSRKA